MKKILVSGAEGFIGRHVLDVLQSRGTYEIHAVRCKRSYRKVAGIRWHQADLLDAGQTAKLIKDTRPDFLLHFAWCTKPKEYWTSEQNRLWENASIDLAERFYENGGKKMVGAGTCAEYKWSSDVFFEQETPLQPATLYGQCKSRVASFLEQYSRKHGVYSAWGRIFFVYGPYEDPCRFVPSIMRSLLENKPALCTHGTQCRDFLYVKDVASAFVALLESDVIGAVNISSGQPVVLKDVIYRIADMLHRRELIQLGSLAAPKNETRQIVGDNHRLTDEVGWRPGYDLETGLAQTMLYWRKMREK